MTVVYVSRQESFSFVTEDDIYSRFLSSWSEYKDKENIHEVKHILSEFEGDKLNS
jgi:hypothetical protein